MKLWVTRRTWPFEGPSRQRRRHACFVQGARSGGSYRTRYTFNSPEHGSFTANLAVWDPWLRGQSLHHRPPHGPPPSSVII